MGKHLAFDTEPTRPYQARACPADFADVFIRGGWAAVRAEFGLHSATERRCLEEAGGEDLKRLRRDHVAKVRRLRKTVQHRHEVAEPVQMVSSDLKAAVAFLRSREGGGWLVTATGQGDWFFGALRVPSAEIFERARRKGWASVECPPLSMAG